MHTHVCACVFVFVRVRVCTLIPVLLCYLTGPAIIITSHVSNLSVSCNWNHQILKMIPNTSLVLSTTPRQQLIHSNVLIVM